MIRKLFLLSISLWLAGCSVFSPTASVSTETVAPTSTATPTQEVQVTPKPGTTTPEAVTLRIWVPPQFDPQGDSPGAALFRDRLAEFSARRPNTKVEVRVKALYGPGGLLDGLITASAAAPLAVPDLIALPRDLMETAGIKGLLHSYQGLTDSLEDPDWYDYARQLSRLGESLYGIPFAGDALVMVYRPSVVGDPPVTWSATLELGLPVAFPAADPHALYTLTMYQSLGGVLLDEEGRPTLDVIQLTEVFTYYHQASASGVMPLSVTQYEKDEQSWQAFVQGQSNIVVTWMSRYLQNPPPDAAVTALPTADGKPVTLATGWVWALSSAQTERHQLAAELAEYLSTTDFLTQWNAEEGYLPVRPSSQVTWLMPPVQTLAGEILPEAKLVPSLDVLNTVGPVLKDAIIDVLKNQADPLTSASSAVEKIVQP